MSESFTIYKQYLDVYRKIYYSAFIYKITNLTPLDLYNLFLGNNTISLPYNDSSTYTSHQSLFLLLPFIYIDITPFYKYLNDNAYHSLNDLIIKHLENNNIYIKTFIEDDTKKIHNDDLKELNKDNENKQGIIDIYMFNYNDKMKDDNEYKEITEYYKESKFLSIKNFINVMKSLSEVGIEQTSNVINSIKVLNYVMWLNIDNIKDVCKLYKYLKIKSKDTSLIINEVDNILSNYSKDTILTYLKIRSDNDSDYNSRFNVTLYKNKNKDKNIIIKLLYNDDNIKYYDDRGNTIIKDKTEVKSIVDINTMNYTMDEKKYDNSYILGPFTQIFNYDKYNKNIANEMEDVKNSLINNIPVFIIGYGASGSGKTSSLIYLNKGDIDKRNGIVVHLCDYMANNGYKNIQVKCREIRKVLNKKEPEILYVPSKHDESVLFVNNNNVFKLNQEYVHMNIYKEKNGEKITFNTNTTIGEFIIYMIDKDRFVSATPNNLNSSRSHSLVFLKIIKDENISTTLIIGDFAGVENEFNCENDEIKKEFYNLKYSSNQLYYDKYKINEIYKPIQEYIDKKKAEIVSLNKDYNNFKNNAIIKNSGNSSVYFYEKLDNSIYEIYIKDFNNFFDVDIKAHRNIINTKLTDKLSKEDKRNVNISDYVNIYVKTFSEYKINIKEKLKLYINKTVIDKSFEKIIKKKFDINNSLNNKTLVYYSILYYVISIIDYFNQETINEKYNLSNFIQNYTYLDKTLIFRIVGYIHSDAFNADDVILKNHDILKLWHKFMITGEFNKENYILFLQYTMRDIFEEIIKEEVNIINNDIDNYEVTQYGEGICKIRTTEGIFINKSLENLRDMINYIIIERNKSRISVSPPFVNECLSYYCKKDNCFHLNSKHFNIDVNNKNNENIIELYKNSINSIIFNLINEEIGNDIIKLIICIFCVFNISKNANNPPPIPYIDINDIKYNYNNKNYDELKELLINFEINNDRSPLNKFKKDVIKIKDILTYLNTNNYTNKENIEKFIEYIDRFNSSSAVGTLEYLDSVAKYNTVNNMCQYSKLNEEDKDIFEETYRK